MILAQQHGFYGFTIILLHSSGDPQMSEKRQIFSTSFFLYNSAKGFCLHKARKNNIASTFKFKSKTNNPKNALPLFNDDVVAITEELHHHAKQRLSQCRKFKSMNLNSTTRGSTNQCQRNQNGMIRYQRAKCAAVILEPTFPQIQKKKIKAISKSFRNIQDYKQDNLQELSPYHRNSRENAIRTLELNSNAKNNDRIQELITKEVLKTQNQAVLRQNQIKFDEVQAKFPLQSFRKSGNASKKRKKNRESHPENSSLEKKKNWSPEMKQFSPMKTTKIKFETMYPKQRKSTNQLPFVPSAKMKNLRRIPEAQPSNIVRGWQNQSISESSQIFQREEQKIA